MVAKHVGALEQRLGARLLNRTTRKQRLTEFGRQYLERCQVGIAEADVADALAQTLHISPCGRLRVNAPMSFGRYGLTPLMTSFLRAYPAISLELSFLDRIVDPV